MNDGMNDPVTRRMDVEPPVTRRMDDPIFVTRRMDDSGAFANPTLTAGQFVEGRYKIIDGPLGEQTGEAEVYRGRDENTGDTIALKLYLIAVMPKESVLGQLRNLSHPNIVRLLSWGTWNNRFYEVLELCEGGTLADRSQPYSECEVSNLLPEILSGLQFLHVQGVIHRDIKPTNLFFRSSDQSNLVIADFGISSYLGNERASGYTETYTRITPEFAAPELRLKGEISQKTDYYSLGITLCWLIAGHSPFLQSDGQRMRVEEILALQSREEVPLPTTASTRAKQLIRGLIRFDPQHRWGYPQVNQWLKGEEVISDQGYPDSEYLSRGKSVPYPGFPAITNPREMAVKLEQFSVKQDLFRGFISQWVHANFDAELGGRVADIQENYSDDPDFGVFKLKYILDPSLPLTVRQHSIHSLDELAVTLEETQRNSDAAASRVLEDYLYGGRIECWIEALQKADGDSKLIQTIKDIREHFQDRAVGLFALYYTLRPNAPFAVGIDSASTPAALAALIVSDSASFARGITLLKKGWIEAWLTGAGRLRSPQEFNRLTNSESATWGTKMQAVLRWLDPQLPGPKLQVRPESIVISSIPMGSSRDASVRIWNAARGYLSGTIRLANAEGGSALNGSTLIEGEPNDIKVTINSLGLSADSRWRNSLVITTNGGSLDIPISYRITAPWLKMIARSCGLGLVFSTVLGLFRLLFQTVIPTFSVQTLDWTDLSTIVPSVISKSTFDPQSDNSFFIITGALLVAGIGGWIYWLYRMQKIKR